jgi:FOG: EAL domain
MVQQLFYMGSQTERILNQLIDIGAGFDQDDSGSGYSVLLFLKCFPNSYIKMDNSFTQGILNKDTPWLLSDAGCYYGR